MLQQFLEILRNPKNQRKIFIIIFLLVGILIFIFNYTYPIVEDDWTYAFVWESIGCQGRQINNFSDLFDSQYAHYMQWGGRTIVHIIAQLLLQLDDVYQDILNTLAYLLLMLLIYKYANINNSIRASVFLLGCLLFWIFEPIICSTCFWITGSANYLWGTLILISFAYPFYSLYINRNGKHSILKSILLFLYGIIAGWTNENMVLAIIVFILAILILLKFKKTTIPNWAYWGFLGLIIGSLFLYLAPGNMVRYNAESLSNESLLSPDILFQRLANMLNIYIRYVLLLSILSLASIIYYYKKGNLYQKNTIAPMLVLLFITAHIAFFAMMGTPIFPERAMFGLIVLLIISVCLAYANAPFDFENKKVVICIFIIFTGAIIGCGIDYQHKLKKVYTMYSMIKYRESVIEKGKIIGIQDFIFDDQFIISKRYHYWDLLEDPEAGKNKAYSHYNNINSVIVIDRTKDTVNQQLIELKICQDSLIEASYDNNY